MHGTQIAWAALTYAVYGNTILVGASGDTSALRSAADEKAWFLLHQLAMNNDSNERERVKELFCSLRSQRSDVPAMTLLSKEGAMRSDGSTKYLDVTPKESQRKVRACEVRATIEEYFRRTTRYCRAIE